jgi:hypothetical protein
MCTGRERWLGSSRPAPLPHPAGREDAGDEPSGVAQRTDPGRRLLVGGAGRGLGGDPVSAWRVEWFDCAPDRPVNGTVWVRQTQAAPAEAGAGGLDLGLVSGHRPVLAGDPGRLTATAAVAAVGAGDVAGSGLEASGALVLRHERTVAHRRCTTEGPSS